MRGAFGRGALDGSEVELAVAIASQRNSGTQKSLGLITT
jgi:hypothetical protein